MIVDVHTHVFVPERDFGPQTWDDMQRCGVDPATWGDVAARHLETTRAADVAIVFGLQAAATGWHVPNDEVARHVATAPQRLVFFAAIDPGRPDFRDELRRCHEELHCAGVKLAPIYQGVHPLDPRFREIYAYCQEQSLPIMIHMATTFSSGTPLDYGRPAYMDQVATDFPELRIVLAHMGHPWEGEAIAAIRRNRHVYADVSALFYRPWQFYNSMRLACEYRTDDKILLGSDFPFTTTRDTIAALRQINSALGTSGLPPVPSEAIERIINRDALSALGLVDPRSGGAV